VKKKKLYKKKYELAQSFLKRFLKNCQENHDYCGHPNKDCSGCNIYEMCKGNEDQIESWILQQHFNKKSK